MIEPPLIGLSTPSVYFSAPASGLFTFPPASLPITLPPPTTKRSIATPFTIPANVYVGALSAQVPITIAIIYAVTVTFLNQVNKRRGYKPWAISKTRLWFGFVIIHNVFLAIYSAWTCVYMVKAIATTWPGIAGVNGLAGAVDSMCKIHGPRGLGNAVTYNTSSNHWQVAQNSHLLINNHHLLQNPTDVGAGRMWNEGLAFYGWIFYLSKFYEVLDTLIILGKGKRSSTLQTYHHAGAMMGMWAGIRFMAPPIWMFVLVNSGIHALMYTYYTLTALSCRIPISIKRMLTTLQILQFVVGASFAAVHLFVSYDIPVRIVSSSSSGLPLAAAAAANSVSASMPSSDGGLTAELKKLVLRAGGVEGAAQNALNSTASTEEKASQQGEGARYYRPGLQQIQCTDTSGQAFAIYLNVVYLLPLTGLFVRFFIKSYLRRSKVVGKPIGKPIIEKAGKDAWKGISREVVEAVTDMHGLDDEVMEEKKQN